MIKIGKQEITTLIENNSLVKIYYYDEEINGQILQESKDFILIRDLKDWHFDGYMILKKNSILRIEYGKLEQFREKLIIEKSIDDDISWLKLNSLDEIIMSLQNNYNKICIEGADYDVNQFVIGKIKLFDNEFIYLNSINIYAEISDEEIKIPKYEVTSIFFADEYSKGLFNYLDKGNQL